MIISSNCRVCDRELCTADMQQQVVRSSGPDKSSTLAGELPVMSQLQLLGIDGQNCYQLLQHLQPNFLTRMQFLETVDPRYLRYKILEEEGLLIPNLKTIWKV